MDLVGSKPTTSSLPFPMRSISCAIASEAGWHEELVFISSDDAGAGLKSMTEIVDEG